MAGNTFESDSSSMMSEDWELTDDGASDISCLIAGDPMTLCTPGLCYICKERPLAPKQSICEVDLVRMRQARINATQQGPVQLAAFKALVRIGGKPLIHGLDMFDRDCLQFGRGKARPPMVKAEPWTPKTPMVKVEPMVKAEPFSPTRSPKVRLRLRKGIKSPHYLAAFKIKLKKSGGRLSSPPAICSTFLAPPSLPATPPPAELTPRKWKKITPKSVVVTQDMLWEANVELQQQVNDLNKELNDLNEELITSQQEVLQLDTTLMRCREAHEKTVAEQVALMFRDLEFD